MFHLWLWDICSCNSRSIHSRIWYLMQRWGGPSVSSGKFKRNFKYVFVLCLKVIVDFKINFEIYSKMYCAHLQLWCCYFNHCELNSVHYYRQAKFYKMTERWISVSIYKASTVLYGCDSCGDCVTVFALFLFASTLDHKLINRSNSLFHAPFQVSVCVSEWVRAASWLWASYVRGGPVSPVSPALPSQPATTVGPQCARGISDPTHLHSPGHRSFCRLPLRRPDSQSHISHTITNNRALLKCLSSRLQHESLYQFWQLQAWKLRTQRFTPPTEHI